MKILLYNWANFDDAAGRGGGVRVYQAHLVEELLRRPGIEVYTLSSGTNYALFRRAVYVRERRSIPGVRSFEVVNSPVSAPAHTVFYSLDAYLDDNRLKAVLREFIEAHGPFNVIQFDNLEGLTAGALELKQDFPNTRFIYYMHNYNVVCPQVNLWYAESVACDDYNGGKRCTACLPHYINMREVKIAYAVANLLEHVHIERDSLLFRMVYKNADLAKRVLRVIRRIVGAIRWEGRFREPTISRPGAVVTNGVRRIYTTETIGDVYKKYRERNLANLNDHFDAVLAVSRRVREIAVAYGIAQSKIQVVYIGSALASASRPTRLLDGESLKIAYLGYERADKGFYHFLDALEAMPRSVSRRISVLIAAKLRSGETLDRLKRISVNYAAFDVVDGFEHRSLEKLLADVDLGIVPVLWEDNLPQVAIEFVAHGVPVLSSDLGGAKELCGDNGRFVYRHGSVDALISRILFFLNNRNALRSYEDQRLRLTDMEQHVGVLLRDVYGQGQRDSVSMPAPRQRMSTVTFVSARC